MKKTNARLQILLELYLEDKATILEKDELWDYVNDPVYTAELEVLLVESYKGDHQGKGMTEMQKDLMLDKIFEGSKPMPGKTIRIWPRIAAAAIIVLGLGGLMFYLSKQKQSSDFENKITEHVIPGGNKAILTLADGKRIVLEDAKNGLLTQEGSTSVNKTADGQLTYQGSNSEDSKLSYNRLEIPRGGQYQLILPDGSKVWLNAASTLIYPTSFDKKERKVEIIGEAYFEIAKDKNKPFRVVSNEQIVEVLGTHFNVSNYPDDEFVKTTLLEGSVRVVSKFNENSHLLKPGEQISISESSTQINHNVDLEEAVAWKNGYFKFNENLESILTKLSRWYDVDIVYQTKVSPELVVAEISRSRNIQDVLKMIESTGDVHFKIEGRRVIVMK